MRLQRLLPLLLLALALLPTDRRTVVLQRSLAPSKAAPTFVTRRLRHCSMATEAKTTAAASARCFGSPDAGSISSDAGRSQSHTLRMGCFDAYVPAAIASCVDTGNCFHISNRPRLEEDESPSSANCCPPTCPSPTPPTPLQHGSVLRRLANCVTLCCNIFLAGDESSRTVLGR